MTLALALAGALLSAALFGLSFAPIGVWPLALVCLVPLLLALRSGSLLQALFLSWLWAVVAAIAISSVFPSSVATYFAQPLWMGWTFAIAIYSVMASVYYMAFAPVYRMLVRTRSFWLPLAIAAAWVTAELARGRLLTGTEFLVGNPWGLMGYTLAGVSPLAQGASLFGVYGLSFVVVAVNAGISEWLVALANREASSRVAMLGAAVATAPMLLTLVYGLIELREAPEAGHGDGAVPIAIVQGNVSMGRTWRSDYYGENLDLYLDLTQQSIRDGDPQIVFWPEGALTFFLDADPSYRRAMTPVLAWGDVELLVGGPSGEGDREPPYYNSVFRMSPQGEVTARYDKQYLVPFSEFLPLSGLDFVQRRLDGARVLTHGVGSGLLETRAGWAGVLVCNEAMLPEVAGARVAEGAQYLFSPSNDSWLAGEGFAEHMLQVVSLRAIEQRRYLVRASTSGPSAVIDPWGRVSVRSDAFARNLVLGLVRPLDSRSFYSQVGDGFALLCALGVLAALLAGRFRRVRSD